MLAQAYIYLTLSSGYDIRLILKRTESSFEFKVFFLQDSLPYKG